MDTEETASRYHSIDLEPVKETNHVTRAEPQPDWHQPKTSKMDQRCHHQFLTSGSWTLLLELSHKEYLGPVAIGLVKKTL